MKKQQERRSGRKWRVALVAAALGLALAGCSASAASSHEHEWEAATCETPRVCKTCGETDGEPLGHTWQEATCLAPKTCTVCGKRRGGNRKIMCGVRPPARSGKSVCFAAGKICTVNRWGMTGLHRHWRHPIPAPGAVNSKESRCN